MSHSRLEPAAPRTCQQCGSPTKAGSPHVEIHGSSVRVFCSETCRTAPALQKLAPPPRRLPIRALAVVSVAAVTPLVWPRDVVEPKIATAPQAVYARKGPKVAHEKPRHVSEDPADRYFAQRIATDRWVHPLRSPRRMPQRDGRVFGAERPGERPPSCRSGHCGVDVGGVWGEPIFATSDGEVVRVVRRLNPDHGGRYVKLSHRDGTVFTQYFHLAGIPPWIRKGTQVKAGQLIGLLGLTGIKRSGPHLHFTISVKPGPKERETFVDPEPLIALWPVVEAGAQGPWIASTGPLPGVPHGASGRRGKRKRKRKRTAQDASDGEMAMQPEIDMVSAPEAQGIPPVAPSE